MRDIFSPPNPEDNFSIDKNTQPLHLLHLLGLVAFRKDNSSSQQPPAAGMHIISHLTSLLESGVELQKKEEVRGLKVSFSNGVMTMNPLKIKGDTADYFENLIAFEQGYKAAAFNAYSYVVLMNSLFRLSRDVEALSSDDRGILIRDPLIGLDVDVENLIEVVRSAIHTSDVFQGCREAILEWI